METTFIIRHEELNSDFIKVVKRLFKDQKELQITITPTEDFGLNKTESEEAYWNRLNRAAVNVESRTNVVEITEDELDSIFSWNL